MKTVRSKRATMKIRVKYDQEPESDVMFQNNCGGRKRKIVILCGSAMLTAVDDIANLEQ